MKTESMQKMLAEGLRTGKLACGKSYHVLPTDCKGDGYDIAIKARSDESGEYDLGDGVIAKCECAVKVGSAQWSNGIPALYDVEIYRPSDRIVLDLGKLTPAQRRQLNAIARKFGYGRCDSVVIDALATEVSVKHEVWGFRTFSGKFFPHVRTTRWFGSGFYSPANTTVFLPKNYKI